MRILSASKKHALTLGKIACVGDVVTVNVARGCAGQCAFCYARCYAGAPEPDALWIYRDLPGQLRRELDARQRKGRLPGYVVFSTSSDPFLGGPQVLETTRACLSVLLRRGVGVSLSTRGIPPDSVMRLFATAPRRVHVTVPIASLSEAYTAVWEPGTVPPQGRLFLLQRLQDAGLKPEVHIEPVIPFVNDSNEDVRDLVSAIVGLGFERAMVSLLQLRPGVVAQLRREGPAEFQRLVLGGFPSQQHGGAADCFDHLNEKQAMSVLRRVQRVAREHGLRVSACRCLNPGLPAGRCQIAPDDAHPRGQSELFEPVSVDEGEAGDETGDTVEVVDTCEVGGD